MMINSSLLKKEIRENSSKCFICFLLLSILALVIVLNYPAAERSSFIPAEITLENLQAENMPHSFHLYTWSRWNSNYLYGVGVLTAIILGMGVFAYEKASGTIIFLTSTPLSKRIIYNTKVAAGLILLGVCVFASTGIYVLASSIAGYPLQAGPFYISSLILLAGLTAIFQLTVIFSMKTSDPVQAGAGTALLCFMLSIPGWFAASKHFSFFYHMQGWNYFYKGHLPWFFFLTMLVLILILHKAGAKIWQKQEI